MWDWLKKKLGIFDLQGDVDTAYELIHRLEKHTRIEKRPMRYDEIERARKQRYKKARKKGQ